MAIAFLMEFPGVTQEQYDAVMTDLELQGMPDGGIAHLAAPMDGGWRVLDVWESKEHFDRFYDAALRGALEKNGVPQPDPKVGELHNVMTAEHAPISPVA
jgi:hypothetical protein